MAIKNYQICPFRKRCWKLHFNFSKIGFFHFFQDFFKANKKRKKYSKNYLTIFNIQSIFSKNCSLRNELQVVGKNDQSCSFRERRWKLHLNLSKVGFFNIFSRRKSEGKKYFKNSLPIFNIQRIFKKILTSPNSSQVVIKNYQNHHVRCGTSALTEIKRVFKHFYKVERTPRKIFQI